MRAWASLTMNTLLHFLHRRPGEGRDPLVGGTSGSKVDSGLRRDDGKVIAGEALRQPALAPAIVLGVAVGFAGAGLVEAEIEFLDVRVLAQLLGRALEHDAAVFHDIAVI